MYYVKILVEFVYLALKSDLKQNKTEQQQQKTL